MRIISNILIIVISMISTPAFAYIGPGLGAGTVGVILGVIGSIFLALFAIFWYPIKRLLKKFKKGQPAVEEVETETNTETETDKTAAGE
jgi:hypothetical protein